MKRRDPEALTWAETLFATFCVCVGLMAYGGRLLIILAGG